MNLLQLDIYFEFKYLQDGLRYVILTDDTGQITPEWLSVLHERITVKFGKKCQFLRIWKASLTDFPDRNALILGNKSQKQLGGLLLLNYRMSEM